MTTISIPDAIRPFDLWVDFETYAYCDTVALRPMTEKGAEFVAGVGSITEDDLHEVFHASTVDELRVLRREFDEHVYDLIISLGYALSVRRGE